MTRLLSIALLLLTFPAHANPGETWGDVLRPSAGPTRVIGSYANGCIAGANRLPAAGTGYRVMRPSRNRYYGHPSLLDFIQRLGRDAEARHLGPILVGDLGQPRGGPMSFGHRSHQIGLDVDIWFREASGRATDDGFVEDLPMLSMIDAAAGHVLAQRWGRRQRELLFLAAQMPGVDRIFVNPVIKAHLCDTERERAWLGRLRPWWGHDEHFHVRLGCPADSPDCAPQKPVEAGDGCDEGLTRWVREQQEATRRPKPPAPRPPAPELPEACTAVFTAPAAAR